MSDGRARTGRNIRHRAPPRRSIPARRSRQKTGTRFAIANARRSHYPVEYCRAPQRANLSREGRSTPISRNRPGELSSARASCRVTMDAGRCDLFLCTDGEPSYAIFSDALWAIRHAAFSLCRSMRIDIFGSASSRDLPTCAVPQWGVEWVPGRQPSRRHRALTRHGTGPFAAVTRSPARPLFEARSSSVVRLSARLEIETGSPGLASQQITNVDDGLGEGDDQRSGQRLRFSKWR